MNLASVVVLAVALLGAAFLIGGRYSLQTAGNQVLIMDRLSGDGRVCDRDYSGCRDLR